MTKHAPKGSMGVEVTPKSKMAALVRDSGSVLFDLSVSSNKSSEPLLDDPATSEYMSASPPSGKFDAMLDSFVTTTPTIHVRVAKALFNAIMHSAMETRTNELKKKHTN